MKSHFIIIAVLYLIVGISPSVWAQKPRLLITTDIGGDPDDQQSLIRLMVFANEFDIEGIITSASGTPGELKEAVVRPDLVREIITAYGEVYDHLIKHDSEYPLPDELLGKIKTGNRQRGWEYIGEGYDTEASEWIIQMVDEEDEKLLNICIWGGQTDLAQALWKVKNTRNTQAYQTFISKVRVYDIADQDNIFQGIWDEHPGLFYILNKAPTGKDKREAVFRGMYLGGDEDLTSLTWLNEHIIERHGPLGALYPQKTWTAPNPYSAMKEGDTPSWFYFLNNGLQNSDYPGYGGWGGRFIKDESGYFRDAKDSVGHLFSARAAVWRWRPDFQHAFAARMDWCVSTYDEANHPPVARLNIGTDQEVVYQSVTTGSQLILDASSSHDPDGDSLSFHWMIYPEAGSYTGEVSLSSVYKNKTNMSIPQDAAGKEIHIILRVKDQGTPSLTAYRRIVLYIE